MMIDNQDFCFLKALRKEPVEYTPIWIMRQAGRYLPEYREIRAKTNDFLTLCKTPELACQVTLQPLKRYALDAAIIFSDILTIPDAMGLGLSFEVNEGPRFLQPIENEKQIAQLYIPDMGDLEYVFNAIKLVRKEINGKLPLIGFAGSPWTLATYMVEGGTSKNFHKIKRLLFTHPTAVSLLLQKLVLAVSAYLKAQVAAGAQALMLFDTWGGILTSSDYQVYSLGPMSSIMDEVKHAYPHIPFILFTKNGNQWLPRMAKSGADAIGIDWTIDIGEAKKQVGNGVALQGNMDPSILYGSGERIREEVQKILAAYGSQPGHIFNLGHGIHPDISPEKVQNLVDAVHELSRPYHYYEKEKAHG